MDTKERQAPKEVKKIRIKETKQEFFVYKNDAGEWVNSSNPDVVYKEDEIQFIN